MHFDPSSTLFPHCNIGCCAVSLLPSTFNQTEVFVSDLWYIISQNCNLGLVPGFPLKQIAYWRLDGTDANITYVFVQVQRIRSTLIFFSFSCSFIIY